LMPGCGNYGLSVGCGFPDSAISPIHTRLKELRDHQKMESNPQVRGER